MHFFLVRVAVDLECIPETLGMKQEYNLDVIPVHWKHIQYIHA